MKKILLTFLVALSSATNAQAGKLHCGPTPDYKHVGGVEGPYKDSCYNCSYSRYDGTLSCWCLTGSNCSAKYGCCGWNFKASIETSLKCKPGDKVENRNGTLHLIK